MTSGGPREIQLTKGFFALVDAADFDWLNQWRWHVVNGYAARAVKNNGVARKVYMHRVILAPGDAWVDHINGDRRDNRRANLRFSNRAENVRNAGPHRGNRAGFKGVRPVNGRWMANICADRQAHYLGCFGTPEEAARAYDAAALRLHGEFARLNFPEAA